MTVRQHLAWLACSCRPPSTAVYSTVAAADVATCDYGTWRCLTFCRGPMFPSAERGWCFVNSLREVSKDVKTQQRYLSEVGVTPRGWISIRYVLIFIPSKGNKHLMEACGPNFRDMTPTFVLWYSTVRPTCDTLTSGSLSWGD